MNNENVFPVSVRCPESKILEQCRSIVGIGYCMKPKAVACPSISDHHGCAYLEKYCRGNAGIPDACKDCQIGKVGLAALGSGKAFYIMTSAEDILFDVYMPALKTGEFEAGLFVLCKYSFKPFYIGMHAAGLKGYMFAFCGGDCRDYGTWLKADRGEKTERTELDIDAQVRIESLIGNEDHGAGQAMKIIKRGNVFYPDNENWR